ncbi:uncharacterized protein LOC122004393 [Zingiber officinale]|uniref:uncharacterized protein LOC122004393 n=1 Tax=Zingiber officinale TaxID=94328 RepID=UPI001C4CC577|nr:uncharacterized protein LOC122004393 [Zingiber officinale]
MIVAVSKLKGCIRQIEELNPSGASEEDIMNRAQMLLVQDPNYSKGFKFGHVWSILQGIEKFNSDNVKAASTRVQRQTAQADYSQSYNLEKDVYSPSSPHVSSFNLNITHSDSGDTSTKRPIGVKKAKLKRKNEQQFSKMVSQNDELVATLDQSTNVAMFKEENKILFKDLNTIADPIMREFIHGEQVRIMQKRTENQKSQSIPHKGEGSRINSSQEEGQGSQDPLNGFGKFYDYFGGLLGGDFSEY